MITLIQRVRQASVEIANETVGAIEQGLLAMVAVERFDTEAEAQRLVQRLLGYRLFGDPTGRMNSSVVDIHGGMLLVPQFTLAADTKKGMRPSFSKAASPELGKTLFSCVVNLAQAKHSPVSAGMFGADMQVHLINDGPVTFWLQVSPPRLS